MFSSMIQSCCKVKHQQVIFNKNRVNMSDVYDPPERVASESHCRGMQKYQEMYNESIDDPSKFWKRICQQFYWKKPPTEG